MNNTELPWSDFSAFPDPMEKGYLLAPFGPGVYELKNTRTNELVYVGEAKNTAFRMSSLLPAPIGDGTRNNTNLRKYVLNNLTNIQYRTLPCIDKFTAKQTQNIMIATNKYLFN